MTKALAAQEGTQKSAEDLLSAVQNGATSEEVEELLQSYKSEVNELLIQQNRPKYTQEQLIEALAENQIKLQKNQETLQQQIAVPSAPPENNVGTIFSIMPLVIGAIALLLAICAVYRGNTQTENLRKKQKQIDDLNNQVESLNREIKLLKATIRPVQNSFDNSTSRRQAPPNNFVEEIPQPVTPPILKKNPEPVATPPRNIREEKEKSFLKDLNNLLAESKTPNFSRTARTEFIKKYSIKSFSCANYSERMNNPSLAPEFTSANSTTEGDFWAYKVDNIYLVVPSPMNSIYNDNLHLERAMSEVFDSNFIQGKTYDRIFVEKVATFFEGWKKENKGTLRLS